MDHNSLIGLLPAWLLIAPPVLALISTFVDGTWTQGGRDRMP